MPKILQTEKIYVEVSVKNVLVFSIMCRKNQSLNKKVSSVLFELISEEKPFVLIENVNIDKINSRRDGLGLIESWKTKFETNYIVLKIV